MHRVIGNEQGWTSFRPAKGLEGSLGIAKRFYVITDWFEDNNGQLQQHRLIVDHVDQSATISITPSTIGFLLVHFPTLGWSKHSSPKPRKPERVVKSRKGGGSPGRKFHPLRSSSQTAGQPTTRFSHPISLESFSASGVSCCSKPAVFHFSLAKVLPSRQRVTLSEHMTEQIVILDFGSQYTQVIARRIRECNVYSVILRHDTPAAEIAKIGPKGIILSGGPSSVYAKQAPLPDPDLF